MDCPNCGTWNPDDKDVCWRCQTELPKPVAKEKRKPLTLFGMPLWLWLTFALFLAMTFLGQCFFRPPVGP
jgi:hypothetical protein